MSNDEHIKALALDRTYAVLLSSPNFGALPISEQRTVFQQTFAAEREKITSSLSNGNRRGHTTALATPRGRGGRGRGGRRQPPPAGRASDLIDDERHQNQRIDQAGELAGDFIREVDFPGFVKDLLEGVFDANLAVTIKQMETYQTLLKTASKSIAHFIKQVDDAAAFGYLAENNSDEFGLSFDDDDGGGTQQPKLVDKSGEPVDIGDNQVKAKIMDAKIAMAKEQRKLLRETILMGITRLVVEKGQVKASVVFDMKATEQVKKADKAAKKSAQSHGSSFSASGGLLGSIFGGPKGGVTHSSRKTQISISSAKSQANTELAAKITGFVDIQFKSDYFKLDNFLEIQKAEIEAESGRAPDDKDKAAS